MARPLPPLPGETYGIPETIDEDVISEDNYAVLPEQRSMCLKLPPLEDGDDNGAYLTPLRQLLTSYTLPIRVRAGSPFLETEGGLQEGDGLVLHFIVQKKRVLAADDYQEEIVLPLYASQRYDVLPKERLHDDVIFQTTRDIINCIPLPEKVRVLKDFTDHERDISFKENDVIFVSNIGESNSSVQPVNHVKTVDGVYNGRPISLPDGLILLCTTMMVKEPQTLRQVVQRNDLPVRVRRSDDKICMNIRETREEAHVIATHSEKRRVLSVPVNALVNLRYEESDEGLPEAVVPLYEFVNWTLCSEEVDQTTLPLPLQEIPQPMERVLRQWLDSYDGRECMQEAIDRYASYAPCKATTEKEPEQQEYENFTPLGHNNPRRKPSIRNRLKSIANRRKSNETSDTYDSLSRVTDGQIIANTQIQEMKTVLSAKEKENVKLREENERIRMENQKSQEELDDLTAMNKRYLEKLHQLYIETDDVTGSMEIKPTRVRSNDYVGMTGSSATTTTVGKEPENLKTGGDDRSLDLSASSVEEVAKLLGELDFGGYVESFRKEHVDGKLLMDLDFETLHDDLGMSRLHAKRLLLQLNK